MDAGTRMRVGIAVADPLRALGLETILQDHEQIAPQVCDVLTARRDSGLMALLLDDRVEGADVVDVVSRLRRDRPDMKLIVLGEATDFQYIQTLIGAGARGYLLETTTEAEIRMALEVVLDGSIWAPRKVLARLIDAGGVGDHDGTPALPEVNRLMTSRELEVLELLIGGCSNREIGQKLGIDEVTVKAHLGRMLRKTRSKNRVELTLRALEERQAGRKPQGGND